jgi:hypothetical protein
MAAQRSPAWRDRVRCVCAPSARRASSDPARTKRPTHHRSFSGTKTRARALPTVPVAPVRRIRLPTITGPPRYWLNFVARRFGLVSACKRIGVLIAEGWLWSTIAAHSPGPLASALDSAHEGTYASSPRDVGIAGETRDDLGRWPATAGSWHAVGIWRPFRLGHGGLSLHPCSPHPAGRMIRGVRYFHSELFAGFCACG